MPPSLRPGVPAGIEQALRQLAGFTPYAVPREWVKQADHLEVPYHTLYCIACTRFTAKLKEPWPSHTKKP